MTYWEQGSLYLKWSSSETERTRLSTKTISDNLEMVEALFDDNDNANAEAKRDKPTLYAMQFHD